MLRKSLAFGLVAALAAVLAATALARRDSTPKLTGSDGPGYTINLKSNGKAVKSLKAGSYKIVISDRSSIRTAGPSTALNEGRPRTSPRGSRPAGTKTLLSRDEKPGSTSYLIARRYESIMFARLHRQVAGPPG